MPSSVEGVLKLEDSRQLLRYSRSQLLDYIPNALKSKEPLAFYSLLKSLRNRPSILRFVEKNVLKGQEWLRSSFANEGKKKAWEHYMLNVMKSKFDLRNTILLTMGSYNAKYSLLRRKLMVDQHSELARAMAAGIKPQNFYNITFDRVAHEANMDLGVGHNYLGDFWDVTRDPSSEMYEELLRELPGRSLVVHMDTQEKLCGKLVAESLKTIDFMAHYMPNTPMLFALNIVLKIQGTAGNYTRIQAKGHLNNFLRQLKMKGMVSLPSRNSSSSKGTCEMGCFYFMFKR